MSSTQIIYANLATKRASGSPSGESLTLGPWVYGETKVLGVRTLQLDRGRLREVYLHVRSAKASLGLIDARPTAGTTRLQVGAGASTSGNTIPALPYNLTAAALQRAINALASKPYGNCTVEQVSGSYLIRFPDYDGQPTLQVRENQLRPLSMGYLSADDADGEWVTELRFAQAPAAFTDSAPRVVPAAPYVETIQDGYTDLANGIFLPEIQKIVVPPQFRGTIQIVTSDARKTLPLNPETDGEQAWSDAINALWAAEDGREVTVKLVGPGEIQVTWSGVEWEGENVDPLEANVFSAPVGDLTFTLDLKRPRLAALLRAAQETKLQLEVELEVVPAAADIEDPEVTGTPLKAIRQEVVVRRGLIEPELAEVQEIDWQRPPSPVDYIPFTQDQIVTGTQHYTALIGDGVATSFVLDHNLGTGALGVWIWDESAGTELARDAYTFTKTSDNSATVAISPAPAEDAYLVVIQAAGPKSAFEAHTHTIAQVVGLQSQLDSLSGDVSTLLATLPSTGPGASAATGGPAIALPIPVKWEVLNYSGEPLEIGQDGRLAGLPSRPPYLLPAVHDAAVDALPSPLPEASTNAGKVYQNESGDRVLIPGGGRIRSSYVEDDGYVACDGRSLYPATKDGNSYYPAAFERELWRFFVNAQQLVVGSTLEITFGVELAVFLSNTSSQWVLVIERGTMPQEASPDPTGPNLEDVVWNSSPMLEQRLIVGPIPYPHTAGIRVKRTASGISCDKQLYGTWSGNDDEAPDSADFAIRARLTHFDTENSKDDTKGWLFYRLGGGFTADEEGNQTVTPAQYSITS